MILIKLKAPALLDLSKLEEMMAFRGLVVNMNLIHKCDVREFRSTNPSQGTPFFREVLHRDRFLHYPELEGSVHRLRKVLLLSCATSEPTIPKVLCACERDLYG